MGHGSRRSLLRRVEARAHPHGIDIFAPPDDRQHIATSTWFAVDPAPFQGRPGILEATIRGGPERLLCLHPDLPAAIVAPS